MQPLTAAWRSSQLALRSGVLRQVLGVYVRGFDPEAVAASWDRIGGPIAEITRAGFLRSAASGSAYYQGFRLLRGIAGEATPRLAPALGAEELAGWLELAGPRVAGVLSARGRTDVFEQTFVSLSGSVGRNVMDGGRQTVTSSLQEDGEALGWARATSGDPCAFCAALASQGHTYKSEETAAGDGEPYHPHCGCEPEPVYSREDPLPGRAEEFRDMWDEADGDANNFRNAWDASGGEPAAFSAALDHEQ